jgi:hypothetical protein
VTREVEAAAALEATRVAAVLDAETSAHEATVAQDSTVVRVKDAED